jgi:surface antigen
MRVLQLHVVFAISAALAGPGLGLAQEPQAASGAAPQVARAQFALSVVDREPQQIVSQLDPQTERVYFFTELVGLEGRAVKHVWRYNGEVVAEIPFTVAAERWRAYSSKRVTPGADGRWTVSVVDESGKALHESSLGSAYAGGSESAPPPPASSAPGEKP